MAKTPGNDYFVNHRRGRRFPWTLYHAPLEASLAGFLSDVGRRGEAATTEVLVIGGGLLHELDLAPGNLRMTVIDIDPRAIEMVQSLRDPRVVTARVIDPDELPTVLGKQFDAVYAKEVIEHIVPWQGYLRAVHDILRPGGRLWLSTPNYGEPWLPILEQTVLEVIARLSGFTRKGLHPSKLSQKTLRRGLLDAGFSNITVQPIARRLALVATASA